MATMARTRSPAGASDDLLRGGDGDDSLQGGVGNDTLAGANGSDTLDSGPGNDIIYGGSGSLYGGAGDDTAYGGDGLDWMYGVEGDDTLYGGGGAGDWVDGGIGHDTVYGDSGNDDLTGEVMYGGAGHDFHWVYDPSDQVYEDAGEGADWVVPFCDYALALGQEIEDVHGEMAPQAVTLIGNELGQSQIRESVFNDTLDGQGGNDNLEGNGGDDILIGGAGNDWMDGEWGHDTFDGGAGNDTFLGGPGIDIAMYARDFTVIGGALGEGNSATIDSGTGGIDVLFDVETAGMPPVGLTEFTDSILQGDAPDAFVFV